MGKNTKLENTLINEIEAFKQKYNDKKVVLYGAGSVGSFLESAMKNRNIDIEDEDISPYIYEF